MTTKQTLADTCNVAYALTVIGGKWKISIIWELRNHDLRPAELRRSLAGISEAVLISQLKDLRRDGLVQRIDHQKIPPHVTYRLTPLGKSLEPTLQHLYKWGDQCRALGDARLQ